MSNTDKLSTPLTSSSRFRSSIRNNAIKRDSLAAELERDPQLSTAKRQQRTQALSSHMAHTTLERQAAAAQTAKLEVEIKLREKERVIEQLEGDRRWLAEREKEQREEKEREQAEHLEAKRKADNEIASLRNELLTLREQYVDLEEERSALSRTMVAQSSQISTLSHRASLLESTLTEFNQVKTLAEERARRLEEFQMQVQELRAAQQVASASPHIGSDQDSAIVREEIQRQVKHMRRLESANAKMSKELNVLRENQMSVEVLKEQKRGLERKLHGADELRERVIRLEAELDAARRERKEWEALSAEPSTPSTTPVSITQSLSNLRLAYAQLSEEHGSNVALLRHSEQELSAVQTRETEARGMVAALRKEIQVLKDRVVRSEHKVTLADREVSFLQAMVASFDAEHAAHATEQSSNDILTRLQQLQALVEDYKDTVATLERELNDARAHPIVTEDPQAKRQVLAELEKERGARDDAEQRLQHAEEEARRQLEQIDALEQMLWELDGTIGAGQHIPPGIRVLCLRDNPAQQWDDHRKAAAAHMKNENENELSEKWAKSLEESSSDLNVKELLRELESLREELKQEKKYSEGVNEAAKQEKKRRERLQQIYKGKSDEFREAIRSILGMKLAFYPNGQVRVTSVYDLNAAFVFQPSGAEGEGMKMQLVAQGEGGPEDLPQLMRYWVEQEQCIPGFLASITLECYEKNKMEQER